MLWTLLSVLDRVTRAGTSPFTILGSSLVAVLLVYATSVVHEAAHVVAGELVGHRWVLLELRGSGLAVGILPDDPSGWHRITRSAAGPVAQILVGAALVVPFFAEPLFFGEVRALVPLVYVTWWIPGMLAIGIGLINLLPLPGLDGRKIYRGAREVVASRR